MAANEIVPLVIGGKHFFTEKTFDVKSPSTGKVLHRAAAASKEDAIKAVDAASEALRSWRKTTLQQRQDIFLKAADNLQSRADELQKCLEGETGATSAWSQMNVNVMAMILKDVAGRVISLAGSIPSMKDPSRTALVVREPFGVVLSIAPWNAPYILGTRAVAFPIAAGNTVVFKAPELSPKTMWKIADVFREAGLPDGVINFIAHDPTDAPSVTAALIADPRVRKINFTGSTNVGRVIAKQAGEHLKPVVLELGGKAPAIVWEDADLEVAAHHCAVGAFLNSGQICMSTEKILVHKAIKDDFRQKLAAAVKTIFPAGGEAPILVSSATAQRNKQLVADAVERGASILLGDAGVKESSDTRLRPIVVDGVTTDMDIYQVESFGPTVSLVNIESEEEAIRLANDTDYGLSSAVFTEDLRRGLRIAEALETGAVHINSMSPHDEPSLPHGGTKSSGFGRFNTSLGLEEWTWTKNITYNR
ncbi:Aldehyde/histidinol dehydrogenase [Moelleriella libera RCEF 2490]|uniref:Aldehyde/histidinol dehydrogenase n=1 Tax=Moelleriella libera RCEF 2490 TaxID=1081109 RepID=A0A166U504_9HYPO|nr:Aldehyde/histidinol dehydrogenase [Moelleriella libera RCEF 2490]